MKFKVIFKGDYDLPAVQLLDCKFGLNWADRVRAELGPDVSLSNHACELKIYSLGVEVSEEVAREAAKFGHFRGFGTVEVTVPGNWLNKYVSQSWYAVESDGKTIAYAEWAIDKEAVVRDWIAAGCPKEWGFDENEGRE